MVAFFSIMGELHNYIYNMATGNLGNLNNFLKLITFGTQKCKNKTNSETQKVYHNTLMYSEQMWN